MPQERLVLVHLLPELVAPERLAGSVAVVVDVLRATTTIVHALAAGCVEVRPCGEVEEARRLAGEMPVGQVLLAGERDGLPIPGFDLGNSPREFTANVCKDRILVLTTTNGTRALLHVTAAERVLLAAFVNFSAVCEHLKLEERPVHIVCAGNAGAVAMEDALLAGALVDFLCCDGVEVRLNDGARLAWDSFENNGQVLDGALRLSAGGARLVALGYDEDIRAAAAIDRFALVPELRRDPLRVVVGAVGVVARHWLI